VTSSQAALHGCLPADELRTARFATRSVRIYSAISRAQE
jgi:hypothetical protein